MIRILHILPSLDYGSGIFNVILNWHRNIDKTKIQFDYLYFNKTYMACEKEIEALGGKIYKLPYPSFLYPWVFVKAVKDFFKNNKYNTIHSHIIHLNFLFYPLAKFYGVKNIIQHSHTIKYSDKIFNGLRNKFIFFLIKPFITKKIACSDLAGKFLFKKNYTIINNGIDTEKFKFNQETRNKIRRELNIENEFVLGHVGRFSHEKNHEFIVDIFNEICKQNKNSVLLLIGDGPLKKEIETKIDILNLNENVIIAGIKKNIHEYYQAMDVFILPSFQEGFGLVAIEAQCCGLPCFISDKCPDNVMICNTIKIPLTKSAKEWACKIINFAHSFKRKETSFQINSAGFSSIEIAKQIQNFYEKL